MAAERTELGGLDHPEKIDSGLGGGRKGAMTDITTDIGTWAAAQTSRKKDRPAGMSGAGQKSASATDMELDTGNALPAPKSLQNQSGLDDTVEAMMSAPGRPHPPAAEGQCRPCLRSRPPFPRWTSTLRSRMTPASTLARSRRKG